MRRIAFILILTLPSAALAAPNTFSELAEQLVRYINAGIGTAIMLGLVVYFYGVSTGLTSLKRGGTEEISRRILWGLLALFVMVSVWGIVGLVRNTLFGGGASGGSFEGGCIDIECL